MGNINGGDEDAGRPDAGDFVLVSNNIEKELTFEPKESIVLSFGIDQQNHPNYSEKSLGNTVKSDALEITVGLTERLGIRSFKVFCSSDDDPSSCTRAGIMHNIEQSASQVGSSGILILFFGGHGVNDKDQKWALAPADYDRTSVTYITAEDISKCIQFATCNAKAVLVILDCCYSGMFGSELTSNSEHLILPNLYVLAAGTASESSFAVFSLEHSIFSYFLKLALDIVPKEVGVLPLIEIYEFCKECTSALTSMILTIDNYGVKTKYTVPSLLHFDPQIEVGVEEVDGEIVKSFEPGRLSFVFDLFSSRDSNRPHPKLHRYTLRWLNSLVSGNYQPLFLMKKRQLFDGKAKTNGSQLVVTIIALLVQSTAVLEILHNPNTVGEPDLFLAAFIHAVSIVDFYVPNCVIDPHCLIHSYAMYRFALSKGHIDDSLLRDLYNEKLMKLIIKPDIDDKKESSNVIEVREWRAL